MGSVYTFRPPEGLTFVEENHPPSKIIDLLMGAGLMIPQAS
jgi:hypothetical protein